MMIGIFYKPSHETEPQVVGLTPCASERRENVFRLRREKYGF